MLQKRSFLLLFLTVSCARFACPQALFPKPVKVLGDPHFIGTASNPLQITSDGPNWVEGRELNFPLAVAVDNSVSPPNIYIADSGNNRVLGFRYTTQLQAGAMADLVLGQVDFFSNLAQGGSNRATAMNLPSGLAVDSSGNLYVADSGNNRILRYPKPFDQPAGFSFPDFVIGQTSLTGKSGNPTGITASSLSLLGGTVGRVGLAFDAAGNLWVTDSANNRVLRYPAAALAAGKNGPSADLVLGQVDFSSAAAASSRTTKTSLTHPEGLSFDPAGRLYVTDQGSRVLIFPVDVASNGAALRILGVDSADTTGTSQIQLNNPLGVSASTGNIIVPDTGNNRLLIYSGFDSLMPEATQFSPSANAEIGQPSYAAGQANQGLADSAAYSFSAPADAAASGSELFVADTQNNRVLVFSLTGAGITGAASRVIGQLDFPYNAVNLIEGKEFNLAGTVSGSAVLDQSATPPHLYVADTANNRILGFADFTHLRNGQVADLVIGQPDFFRNQSNYPTNSATQPNAQGLRLPTAITVDSAGNLYVADTGNSRILRFPAPFASGKTSLETADLVIGQQNFTSIVTDATDRTVNFPFGLTLSVEAANAAGTGGFLIVADSNNNRVLFFPKPFTSGMSAVKVLGQLNLTSNTTSADPQRFLSPRSVAVDTQDRVIVADTGNKRVQIFDKAANIANYATRTLSIGGLQQPGYVASAPKGFWVADQGQGAVAHYPPLDQLIVNASPDSALAALSPRSVFADAYNNVLLADGANRVLYFAPQVSVISAANYSSRAVTAGEIVSVFPIAATAIVGAGSGSFSTLPLPVTLGDTQVLINGTPAPLFFVSPGQVNFVLPNGLPTGGAADLQVLRQSTGQVYGGAELALASASPGLFTSNASGSGQVAAVNIQDGTINAPANPVARGQYISLYGTGVGPVPNPPADGTAPTGASSAADLPQVLIGSNTTTFIPSANITYSGLAPGLVGVWQINILVPQTAQTGSSVPIRVYQNSIPSTDPASSVPGNTTISIK